MNIQVRSAIQCMALLALLVSGVAWAQKVQVKLATPAEAEEDTTLLDVTIDGNGFDDGSLASFLVTGTENPGGVVVHDTQFVNNRKLVATIDIPLGATLGDYDIEVETTRGRRGKGHTLFRVLEKGSTGNENPYDGESIPLVCTLDDANGATILPDGKGSYSDDVQGTECTTGGVAQPNLSGVVLAPSTGGNWRKAKRKIDLALDPCVFDINCEFIPLAVFEAAGSFKDMDHARISLRPYAEQGDIQLLPPDTVHEMAFRIGLNQDVYGGRFGFQMLGRVLPEDFHQGTYCDLNNNPDYDLGDAISQDVSVHVWPDNDGDGVPDGYTVTTGTFDSTVSPTTLTPGSRLATVCSNQGPVDCPGPASGDMCNLLGQVAVQFTWYAQNK